MENIVQFTEEIRKQIIDAIKKEARETASARVGYHAEQILKRKPVQYSIISKIEADIALDRHYKSRPHPTIKGDYEITLTPSSEGGFWKRHPFYEKLVIALISGCISLVVGLTITKSSKQSQSRLDSLQDSTLKAIGDSLYKFRSELKDSQK
jgi:hypothetical protein